MAANDLLIAHYAQGFEGLGMPVMILGTDAASATEVAVLFANSAAENLCGWEQVDIVGRSFSQLLDPADRKRLDSILEALPPSGIAFEEVLWLRKKSGRRVPVRLGISRDADLMILSLEDLSQTLSRSHLDNVIRNMVDALIVTDADGQVQSANEAAQKLLGKKEHDIISRPAANVVASPTFSLERLKGSHDREMFLIGANNEQIPVLLSVSELRDQVKELTGYVMVAKDIRALKAAEAAVYDERQKGQNAAKLAALGEMAGGIAHEINTPLAIIMGRVDLIKAAVKNLAGEHSEKIGSHAEKIGSTVTRISKIIMAMRKLSRDSGQTPPAMERLGPVVEDTLALCQERFRAHHVNFQCDEVPADLEVYCIGTELSQVLLNLLNNAFDAVTEHEQEKPWIHLRVELAADRVTLSIVDSGPGIPPEIREKIMQPFFTTKEVGKGTGLGLSISRSIVESQGGRLYLDADPTHTCFKIEILRQPATQQAA